MLAFRSLLRQTRQRRFVLSRVGVRLQHNSYGPHKEYFQNPNQPYSPGNETSHQSAPGYSAQDFNAKAPSRVLRFIRSTLYAILFLNLGFITGTALITWDYLQPPFEKGSEEDQDLQQDIEDTLDGCSVVESLREAQWVEEETFVRPPVEESGKSQHMIYQTLHSVQGVHTKMFRHPSGEYAVLVFYPGFGCEGWPDTVHGGMLTTLLLDGMETHLKNLQGDSNVSIFFQHAHMSVNFKRPVKPGDIYTILVYPPEIALGKLEKAQGVHAAGQMYLGWTMKARVLQIESAPQIRVEYDSATGTHNEIIDLETSSGHDSTHAEVALEVLMPADEKLIEQINQVWSEEQKDVHSQSPQDALYNKLGASMLGNLDLLGSKDSKKTADKQSSDKSKD